MSKNRIGIILLAFAVIAGIAYAAGPKSRIDARYAGPMGDIAIAQQHINQIRMEIDKASTEEIIASADTVRDVLNGTLEGQADLIKNAIGELDKQEYLSVEQLDQESFGELVSIAEIYANPDIYSYLKEKRVISAADYMMLMTECLLSVQKQASVFVDVVSSPAPSGRDVQINRADLTKTMARFDILVANFILLAEMEAG